MPELIPRASGYGYLSQQWPFALKISHLKIPSPHCHCCILSSQTHLSINHMVSSWGCSEKIVIYAKLCSFQDYFAESKQNMIALLPC